MTKRAKVKVLERHKSVFAKFARWIFGRYADGKKFELLEEYIYQTEIEVPKYVHRGHISMSPSGMLTIRAGFVYDGCSFWTADRNENYTACLIHDALDKLLRAGKIPPRFQRNSDRILKRVFIEHGGGKLSTSVYYVAVRLRGVVVTRGKG